MRPAELKTALEFWIGKRRPTWVEGPPGVGKTSIAQQVIDSLELEIAMFPPGVTLDPVDVRGIPHVKQNGASAITEWAIPDFWPRDPDWKGVIVLDEFGKSTTAVQAAFLQVCYAPPGKKRTLGSYTVPDGAVFLVLSNRQQDRAGEHRIITAMSSRFVQLSLEISLEDWQKWAIANGIDHRIRSFLNFKPAMLSTFDPASNQRTYASPRTWELANDAVDAPDSIRQESLAGCLGEGPAAEFAGYMEIADKLIPVEKVIANPDTVKVPSEPSVAYAMVGSLAEAARAEEGRDKVLKGIGIFAARLKPEFGVLLIRDTAEVAPQVLAIPESMEFIKNNRHLMI
jgi:MoxR-like ATPase